ncbi:hypothetical protein QKU48_gp0012 [Fadolivirus algeromassiliense]|uniref:Uncharacterized protein n=1 Tax=Fadolivirus FV1/VV64 TaxID=3070911 RepID=A0A7D3USD1_9VIRU|nr:hypothetical protein QKU48_gp0012 [Fadolivirus algeromassiliense]QKF93470.1 hypothetical protein Fadolivirus_1_12 [Fadolivirus FV1/VV64]
MEFIEIEPTCDECVEFVDVVNTVVPIGKIDNIVDISLKASNARLNNQDESVSLDEYDDSDIDSDYSDSDDDIANEIFTLLIKDKIEEVILDKLETTFKNNNVKYEFENESKLLEIFTKMNNALNKSSEINTGYIKELTGGPSYSIMSKINNTMYNIIKNNDNLTYNYSDPVMSKQNKLFEISNEIKTSKDGKTKYMEFKTPLYFEFEIPFKPSDNNENDNSDDDIPSLVDSDDDTSGEMGKVD